MFASSVRITLIVFTSAFSARFFVVITPLLCYISFLSGNSLVLCFDIFRAIFDTKQNDWNSFHRIENTIDVFIFFRLIYLSPLSSRSIEIQLYASAKLVVSSLIPFKFDLFLRDCLIRKYFNIIGKIFKN